MAPMRRQMNGTGHRRTNVLLLLGDGWTAGCSAEALFLDAETVREHKRRLLMGGRDGIERLNHAGGSYAGNWVTL